MNGIPNLAGEWLGSYPGHYDEVILIRQVDHAIEAWKVTGDDHVPAGEITWRIDLRTLRGEGQIADKGFRNSRFIPGHLAIHATDRIEFTWEALGSVEYRRDD